MSSSNLIRRSGLAAFVGGTLFVILDIMETLLLGNQAYVEAAATSAWLIVQIVYIFAIALIAMGLVGLYVRMARETGTLGLIAFLAAFIGTMMGAGSTWGEAFFGSWLAKTAPELLGTDPSGGLITGILLTYLFFTLGNLLFGLAALQSKVLPRGAAVLLMIGAVLFALLGFLEISFAGVVLGAALAWLGFTLWSSADDPAWVSEMAR
jgi:hypothetical protein